MAERGSVDTKRVSNVAAGGVWARSPVVGAADRALRLGGPNFTNDLCERYPYNACQSICMYFGMLRFEGDANGTEFRGA